VTFLILIVLLTILFFIVKHLRIKEIVENEIEHYLGINVTINKIDFSPLLAHIEASGITVHNPRGFPEDELAYINSIHFMFDPIEILFQKKPDIYLFTLNLERLNIIKNKEGKVNLKEIIPIKEGVSREAKTSFYFDVVVLNIGKVKYLDYTGPTKKVHNYHIGIKDATFVGLKDGNEIIKMVVYKAIENTDIGKLINLTIVPVVSQIRNTVDAAWDTARSGAKGAWEIANLPFKLLLGKD
jgi:hypothetical protein